MRRPGLLAAVLLAPAAAWGAEGEKPRFDPKELEVQVLRLEDPAASFRERACRKIGGWGPVAKSAIPSLAPLLADPEKEVRRAAASALGRMGKEAAGEADRLADALKDEDAGVRGNAALALEAAEARGARPVLAKALKDADAAVRANAAAALGGLGADDPGSLAALAAALRDDDSAVRSNSAWAVGVPREKARGAVHALCRALTDGSEAVRAMAARSLGRIGETDEVAVPALLKALAAEMDGRAAAAEAPRPKGAPAPPEDGALLVELEKQGGARRNMAWALGRFKAGTKDVKALLKRLQETDPNPLAKAAAKTALERADITVMPGALEEQPKEFPPVPKAPWRMAVVGGSLEVVFRYER